MPRLTSTALLAGGALAVFGGGAATGQEAAKPAPGCNGISVTDKKGDAEPANADVINAFFDMAAGKPVVNVTVQTLDDSTPEAASGVRWYILWTFDGAERYVAASKVTAAGADPVFTYGMRDADGFHTEG